MKKFVSIVASISILVNSLLTPFAVLAQEEQSTPTPEPTAISTEVSSSTPDPTVEPTQEPTVEPIVTSTPESTPDASATPIESLTPEPTQENIQSTPETTTAPVSTPVVTTDKEDYHPTETATITGSFFESLTNLALKVFGGNIEDGNYKEDTYNVVTDSFGSFIFNYVLDNVFRPLYTVQVFNNSGNQVAEKTFTDSPSSTTTASNVACMAENPLSPNGLNCTANDVSLASVSNLIINDDGCKFPGDTVNFTANWQIQANASNRYNVGVWFATSGQASAKTGPANSCSVTSLPSSPAPFFDGGSSCGGINSGATGTLSITMTATCNPDVNGLLKLPYCTSWQQNTGSCTGPTQAVPGTNSKCNCQDGFTVPITVPQAAIEVVKVLSPSNDSGLFNLQIDGNTQPSAQNISNGGTTGKLGVNPGSHTIGETAGTNTSLSNYTASVSCVLRGTQTAVATTGTNPWTLNATSGKDIVCTITNTRINNASLTIIKDAQPNDGQDFAFTTTGTGLSNFSLDDDSDVALSNTKVFSNLSSGTYSVSESAVSGWSQLSATCSDGSPVSAINLSSGENVTCTFVNTKLPRLTLVKTVTNDNGGTALLTSWTLNASGPTSISGISGSQNVTNVAVNAGVYTLSETNGPTGYLAGNWSCTAGTLNGNQLTLTAGQSSTCTINNDDIQPKLTVTKIVINDNGGTKVVSDFPLFVNQTQVTSGVQNGFNVGNYIVSETNQNGYSSTISGNCNVDGSVSLSLGDIKSCTITNDDQVGHLIVNKVTVPNDTQTQFSITASGSGVIAGQATRSITTGTQVDYTVDAGMYSVSEAVLEGWQETGNTCDDVVVGNGETKECTITNTKQGKIIVKKETDPDGDPQSFSFVANYNLNGFSLKDGEQNDSGYLSPSIYSVSENTPAGWKLSSATCSDGSPVNSINLSAGEVVTCTFNNTKLGKIIVEKQTLPDGSTEKFGFQTDYGANFELKDGEQNDSGYLEPALGYSVSEDPKSGWDLDSVICSDGSSNTNIDLSAGEVVTCVFTNSQRGSILGAKLEDSDGNLNTSNDQTNLTNWTIELYSCASNFTGCVLSATDLTDGSGYSFNNLVSGYYQVREVMQNGWTNLTSLFRNITLNYGQTSTDNNFVNFEKATIIVHKDVLNPNGDQAVDGTTFKVKLDGGSEQNISEGNDVTYSNLTPGTYTVTESFVPSGYEMVPFANNSNVVDVKSGETHHVYVVNKQKLAKLTVIKNVINDNGGSKVAGDFTMNVSGQNPSQTSFAGNSNGTEISLFAGEYSADETEVSGYKKTLGENCSGTIAWGEEKTCTITNDDVAPTIKLIKEVINNDGGKAVADDFGISVGGNKVLSGSTTEVEANKGIAINEEGLFGYKFVSITGRGCPTELGGKVSLLPGDNLTCTITNDDIAPELTVIKNVLGTKSAVASDFTINVNGSNVSESSFKGSESGTTVTLNEGEYSVSENEALGFTDTYSKDCTGSIAVGESKTCTVTNTRDTGEIIVKKLIDEDGDAQTTEDRVLGVGWEIDVDGLSGDVDDPTFGKTDSNGEFKTGLVKTGTYLASETQKEGYVLLDSYCSNESSVSEINLGKDETVTCTFVNFLPDPKISIAKSNNKENADNGDVVGYTLKVTNGGNVGLTNVKVYDALPGGFSYVLGTSKVDGLAVSDPTQAGNTLTWNIGLLSIGQTKEVTYDVKIGNNVSDGKHTNFATCDARYGRQINRESISVDNEVVLANNIECNTASSTVSLGTGLSYGGNLVGQVLGASTELPATGNPTWLILLSMLGLTGGLLLHYQEKRKKYAKR